MDIAVAREQARSIFGQVMEAVDPARLVQRCLELTTDGIIVRGERLTLPRRSRLVVFALGKAAPRMMAGAISALGSRIDEGLVITKAGVPVPQAVKSSGYPVIFGGHPVPNGDSICAGEAALTLAESLGPADVFLMLISGGGSALMELPAGKLSLDDVKTTTDSLLRQGADIHQLNAVRQRLSRLKGGKLAAEAHPARIINVVISDVLGSPLSIIASGPTVPFEPTADQGIDWLVGSPVWGQLPDAVRMQLTSNRLVDSDSREESIQSIVIADSRTAAEAAARAARELGYASEVLGVAFTGEAREFARDWVERARVVQNGSERQPVCLVGAGELTVTVRGTGSGGRNSEMVLAAAQCIDGDDRLAIASLATDGDDGTTGAAGGVATGASCRIARDSGLDPARLLEQNDSQTFLDATGGTLYTGLTGTNVNDLYLAFIDAPTSRPRPDRRAVGDLG